MKTFALIRKKQRMDNTTMSAIIISSILLTFIFLTIYPFLQKGLAQQMDTKTNIMMMMDNATGMIMVMDPETGKMYSATGMIMVMDPETGKVMIKDRRCGITSITVMDILKVF